MRTTIVPAQVTTVEDRIAGNLGLSQIILFAVPVFGGSILFAGLPPSMGIATYKLIVIVLVTTISFMMAIRIKGKILLFWMIIILRYNLRPKYYLFNKNTLILREDYPAIRAENKTDETNIIKETISLPRLAVPELVRVYASIDDPARNIQFETNRKGGLYVRYTEIEEQDI